jgi:hypothetical protein
MALPHVVPRITLGWQAWSIVAIVVVLAVAAALLLMNG